MATLIRTDDLPTAERFAFWREACKRALGRLEFSTADVPGFKASMYCGDIGAIRVRRLTMTDYSARRTPTLIRRSDQDLLTVILGRNGLGGVTQGHRQVRVTPGEFVVVDTTRPFEVRTAGEVPIHGVLMLAVPRTLLPLPPGLIGEVTAVRMGTGRGVGGLTARFLADLADNIEYYRPAEAARLAFAALDVLATRLAHELDSGRWVPPETHRHALLVRIHAFIHQRLRDPALSPGTIAAAHHISLRYLYILFQEQDETVAGWIRQLRLEGARRNLADPALVSRTVTLIAARWGFTSASYFGRAFKAAYGMPPQEYRRQALLASSDGPGLAGPP